MTLLKEEINSMITAGQVRDIRTEQEIRKIWTALLKLAGAIDYQNAVIRISLEDIENDIDELKTIK